MTSRGAEALRKWLDANDHTVHSFALSLRLDPQRVYRMTQGKKVDLRLALAIEDATQGAVTCRMWTQPSKG